MYKSEFSKSHPVDLESDEYGGYPLGETFADIGERVVFAENPLRIANFGANLSQEVENGEVGRVTDKLKSAGNIVYASMHDANRIRLLVANNPEVAIGVGIAIAGVAVGAKIVKDHVRNGEGGSK